MKRGFTWNEEYRKNYYDSEIVQEHLKKFIEMASQPKSIEQRKKMSDAARGKPKAEDHRKNMSEAQKFRQALKKQIESTEPMLSTEEVWARVKELSNQ